VRVLPLACVLLAACGARPATQAAPSPVSVTRFAVADPVWVVDDRRDVAVQPAEREEVKRLRGFDIAVASRLDRIFKRPRKYRAIGTNSLDEVPSSTWFENRLGIREVSPGEVAHGPGDGKGPDLSAPLTVFSGKSVGLIPGFMAEDASGVKWLVKFDKTGIASESAADVTVQRLLWLVGYHVPENHAGRLERRDVVVGEKASFKTADGEKRAMTADDLDATFARARPGKDGRYRVLFSRLLDGEPLGGTPQEGVREDDPNDTIPHQRRRELRGLQVFAAWLQHTDFKEMGTLDVWREDPLFPDRHVVFHYLLDFGNTLGLYASNVRADDGHVQKAIDLDHVRSFLSLGMWRRPWEGTRDPGIRGVGAFDVEHFEPGGFSPFSPYVPFLAMDALDARWAVRLMLRITPEHLRAALEAGNFEDPRAIDYLVRVLVGRQKKSARYWLQKVSPLDDFTVDGDTVCFSDLVVAHDVDPEATRATRYRARVFDHAGNAIGTATIASGDDEPGRACALDVPEGAGDDGYTILRLDVDRVRRDPPGVEVHLGRDKSRTRRVIGVERKVPR
jgi:hypothetical protein